MINPKNSHSYWLLLLTLIVASGCSSYNSRYYSYSTKTHMLNPGRQLISASNLISYGDYLFEFIMTAHDTDSISMISGNKSRVKIYTRSGGLYLLKTGSDAYFQFDSFALNNTLIKTGKVSEKEYGLTSSDYDSSISSKPDLYKTGLIDTLINNVQCFYVDINIAALNKDSSYEQKIFLFKDKHLNSFYNLWNAKYIDSNYRIFGIYLFNKKIKQGFVEEPENIRLLTREEKKICSAMVKKISAGK